MEMKILGLHPRGENASESLGAPDASFEVGSQLADALILSFEDFSEVLC